MFEFLMDVGNYEQRKVARNDFKWGTISTARCSDGEKPYETAVEHKDYGEMVIVENYDTRLEAEAGHARWLKTMTAKKLPAKLVNCNNSGISKLLVAFGGNSDKKRKIKRAK